MSLDLYHRAILETAAAAVGAGELASPHGRARIDNPLCGDRIDFDVCMSGTRVSALAHRVRGCLLCEAAASVIGPGGPGDERPATSRKCATESRRCSRAGAIASIRPGKRSPCSLPRGISAVATNA